MSENNKSYRIRTTVGNDTYVSVNLEQDYDTFDILSMKLTSSDVYRLHNSNYGVVVGRVQANGGFGVPNAKISIFISADSVDSDEMRKVYSYSSSVSKGSDGVRYNLLPDEKVADCHQVVGTFPNKRYLLDNDVVMEVFEKYYKYTTRTNNAGDYMICGVPTGNQTIHMDLDLSDCGILSQRPRDFVFKGYTVEQFENPNMFKTGTSYTNLSQIFTQNKTVYVQPFWGNEGMGETIGITRADIEIAFKFEPTCVFMGCIAGDNASNGISKKCIPTPDMGNMDELVTGKGTIEMIRKTYGGSVEEFQVKGTELIDGNGIWCYQIPMNLDYMITDEYGNMVPTDNPDKGIPTRARVRFRISLQDMELNTENYFRPKVLVPHNPQNLDGVDHEEYDYEFGSFTKDESFRDLFWNNVYTVKSYIPRFQKRKVAGWKETKFSGIKHVQNFGANNPMPYNNIRIRLPFMFKVMCILIKIFIKIVGVVNSVISQIGNMLADIGDTRFPKGITIKNWKIKISWWYPFKDQYTRALRFKMNVIDEGLCPDLENWYFAPMFKDNLWIPPKTSPDGMPKYDLLRQTLDGINTDDDPNSIDDQNQDKDDEATCLTIRTDYLISCIEMNLAQEYKVINFDFYNDWINGLIYVPRFMRYMRKKRKFLGITIAKAKIKGCMDDTKIFSKSRRYTQLCSIGFEKQNVGAYKTYSKVTTNLRNGIQIIKSNNLHKKRGLTQQVIFGKNGGICHEKETMYGQHVYYLKPCEWTNKTSPLHRKMNLFATDIVLLGSLNNCDLYGIPQAFKHLVGSSYIMPTNLALTNMEENGPLYAYGDNGTMCSQTNQTTTETNPTELSKPVKVVSGDTALYNELKYYSGASTNYDTEYDDPSDTIAMTEAAGIAWNYTGPGQGEIDKKKLYYPGGHFLGLSCVNSQTNIKSCINLERICELGVAMSQRREDVKDVKAVEINEDGQQETKLEYVYDVPTGFISGDDIIDDDFRKMFATMNKNRLIATKINPDNGYRVYDFQHSNPINFSGEMSKYTGAKTPYNSGLNNVKEESSFLSRLFGIHPAETRDDYDENETANTRTRTVEFPSIDYYMFRFGLSYDDIRKVRERHIRQFGKDDKNIMYLPQYENSFYFYFGLKDGSTALDEFNKQFFSECESSTLSKREPSIYVSVSDFSICDGSSFVVPYIRNMEEPLIVDLDGNKYSFEDESDISGYTVTIGKHKLKVTDSNGAEAYLEFSVGNGTINGSFTPYDFNKRWEAQARSDTDKFIGGYIVGTDVGVNVEDEQTLQNMKIVAAPEGEDPKTSAEKSADVVTGDTYLFLNSANTPYDLYLTYQCNDATITDPETGEETTIHYEPVYLKVASFTLRDTSDLGLTMGSVLRMDYMTLKESAFTENWWMDYMNGAPDSPEAWNVRKSTLMPYESGVPFSNNVISVNGSKWVFGTPQSINGVNTGAGHILSSEYEDDIPYGYSLDDDASYYPTTGRYAENGVYNYNAMTVNGTVVCGDFAAKVSNQPGVTKSMTVVGSMGSLLRNGQGCIFKPIPDGEVIAAYVNGNSIVLLCDQETAEAYTDGVVYPTIVYPAIKRPFNATVNYFEIHDRRIVEVTNDKGKKDYAAESKVHGEKIEASIRNGVTYNRYFCGDSYITGIFEKTEEPTTKILAKTADYDSNDRDRFELFSGYTVERIEDPAFEVAEGFPYYQKGTNDTDIAAYKGDGYDELYADYIAYRSEAISTEMDLNTVFYDDMYYSDADIGGIILWGEGESDSDIVYYRIPVNDGDPVFYEEGFNYLKTNGLKTDWILGTPRHVYVLGYYEKGAVYDNIGEEVCIRITDTGFNLKAYVPWTEETNDNSDEEGDSNLVWHTIKASRDNGIYLDRLGEYLTTISGKTIDMKPEKGSPKVGFKRSIRLRPSAISGGTSSMTKAIVPLLTTSNLVQMGTVVNSAGKFVVIGVKRLADSEGNANGNVYRIYLDPIKSYDYGGTQSYGIFVKANNPTADVVTTFEGVSASQDVRIVYAKLLSAVTDYSFGSSTAPEYVHISVGDITTDSNGTKYVKVTATIDANPTTEKRGGDVILYWSATTTNGRTTGQSMISFEQDGKVDSGSQGGGTNPEPEQEQGGSIFPLYDARNITVSNEDGSCVICDATYSKDVEYIKIYDVAGPDYPNGPDISGTLPNLTVNSVVGSVRFWYKIVYQNNYSTTVSQDVIVTHAGLYDMPIKQDGQTININSDNFLLELHWISANQQPYEFNLTIDGAQRFTYIYKLKD